MSCYLQIRIVWLLFLLHPLYVLFLPFVPVCISGIIWKTSGVGGYPYLIPGFIGIASGFSSFRTMLLQPLLCWGMLSLILYFLGVLPRKQFRFPQRFFCYFLRWLYVFAINSIFVIYYTYWLVYVEESRHFRNKGNLIIAYNLFMYICILFASILFSVLSLYSSVILSCIFLYVLCLYLVLVLEWYCIHRNVGVFLLFSFFFLSFFVYLEML